MRRRLKLAAKDAQEGQEMRDLLGHVAPRTLENLREDLASVAARRGLLPWDAVNRLGYRGIVRAAGDCVDSVTGVRAEAIWRVCSGVAHGRTWAKVSLMSKQVIAVSGDVRVMHLTAPVEGVLAASSAAFCLTERGFALLDQRRRSYMNGLI